MTGPQQAGEGVTETISSYRVETYAQSLAVRESVRVVVEIPADESGVVLLELCAPALRCTGTGAKGAHFFEAAAGDLAPTAELLHLALSAAIAGAREKGWLGAAG